MKVGRENLLAAALAAVFALPAAAEPVADFDRGSEMRPVMESLYNGGWGNGPGGGNRGHNGGGHYGGPQHPPQPNPGPYQPPHQPGHHYDPHPTVTVYYTQSCQTFAFSADSPLVSDRYLLRTSERMEECRLDQYGIRKCVTSDIRRFEKSVGMSIQPRRLLPWENESFKICLKGPELRFHIREAAYSYDMQQHGFDYERTYVLNPQGKIPSRPDPNGLALQSFTYDPAVKTFRMSVLDKWAGYYRGEQTELHVKLIKNRSFWGDQTILERDIPAAPASVYELDLAKFADISNLQPGQYFVQWGFRRSGPVSRPDYVDKGQTDRIEIRK